MDKNALKRIAKKWCQAILLMNDITDEEVTDLLTEEECDYLVSESEKIAFRI